MHRVATRPPRGRNTSPVIDVSPDTVAGFLEDAAHFPGGHAAGVVFPRSESAVAAVVRAHQAVLPIGAQSSLTGGATPMGEIVISLSHLNHILDIAHDRVQVEPGVSLAALQDALDPHSLYYPPAPTFTGATVGGTIATNAAGAATFKYGSTRAWVDALTVVLSSGDVLDLRRGQVLAHQHGYFEVELPDRLVRVPIPTYRMPTVAKRSAGFYAEPEMDLIDLFVGSEGTLGIVTAATLKVLRRSWTRCIAYVPLPSEAAAFALAGVLRNAAASAWRTGPDLGVDIPAIEYVDGRSLSVIPERHWRRAGIQPGPGDGAALFLQLELPSETTAEQAFTEISSFEQHPTGPLARLCQVLSRFGAFERTEIALPGDRRRADEILGLREAVPAAVNDLVGFAKRTIDPAIEKVAGDMVVPFEQLGSLVRYARAAFERRGLDLAIWGHVSDGNLHPNLIPHSADDVPAGKAAIFALGQEVTRLGGCPLAEHGVGRNAVKQALLRQLYGETGIEQMRAVKRALDPEWKLAPGVLFPRE